MGKAPAYMQPGFSLLKNTDQGSLFDVFGNL